MSWFVSLISFLLTCGHNLVLTDSLGRESFGRSILHGPNNFFFDLCTIMPCWMKSRRFSWEPLSLSIHEKETTPLQTLFSCNNLPSKHERQSQNRWIHAGIFKCYQIHAQLVHWCWCSSEVLYIWAHHNEQVWYFSDTMFFLGVMLTPVNKVNKIMDIQRYIAWQCETSSLAFMG